MIHIDVTPAALAALSDSDLKWHKWELSGHFLPWKFRQKERSRLFLHEGSHLHYERACGFEPALVGPTVDYDPERDVIRLIHAGVEELPFEIRMTADPVLVAKNFLGPIYTQEKLLGDTTKEEILKWAQIDIRNFNNWHAQRQQTKGDVEGLTMDVIRESVFKDCRKPAFRRRLWEAAREFEQRVFSRN